MSNLMDAVRAATAQSPMVKEDLPVIPGRVLHVDGDYMAYWAGGIDELPICRQVALNKIEQLQFASQSESVIVHLTHEASTKADRYIIAETKPYQAQRSGKGKPQHWAAMRAYLSAGCEAFRAKVWTNREADDGMAYCARLAAVDKSDLNAIASKDKDLRMLPGVHVNWDDCEITTVPLEHFSVLDSKGKQYGLKWFWLQMLQGDTADNIPGLPKYINSKGNPAQCGEKTAQGLLSLAVTSREAQAIVEGLYEGFYGDEWPRKLLEQALLLWLRTDRHAQLDSVFNVIEYRGVYFDASRYFDNKIKEAYAEAQGIGSGGATE